MKFYTTIIFFLIFGFINSQTLKDENIAQEYYKEREYEKALHLFEDIYKKKKSKNIYNKYISCLIETGSYKKAERTIKSFYKKNNDLTVLIDLGSLYIITGDNEDGAKQFELAIELAKKETRFLPTIANKFYKGTNYKFALEAYKLAKKQNPKPSYSIQISNIYSQLGDIENMYQELIQLLYEFPHYYQTCKNKLRLTITDDFNNENNKKLKKLLIKSVQKNNSHEISKLLVWLFMQENRFQDALDYEISIDKGIIDNTLDIIALGDITFSNKDYETATNAFKYVVNKSYKNSYYYEYSILQLLNIEFDILENKKQQTKSEKQKLADKYEKTLHDLGIKSETIIAVKNYSYILAYYLNNPEQARVFLENAIDEKLLTEHDIAICKMELAKILLREGNIWEAILVYAQVEKKFKEDIIGQQAKFEKIKINYYNGDFEWAKNQLKVLELSTSKLISNNAMKLSLLISDNLNLDTTDSALLLYAKAELLFEQKQYTQSLEKLDTLQNLFPKHTLSDEVLLKKSDIFTETKEYMKALDCLNTICTQYYHDILYDDALFRQAEIYQHIIMDDLKAKAKYEELLLKAPNSIFINDARERYRLLRNNNFLLLQ